ncbi:MAG TPA: methyltransferase domain-containing protein [Pyrinomonadaceae bacterium]|jgi:2-polyprenyl-3-methyl-5-hydroxy-6-metoxy-1,4-benzoquinol methylase/glycosyltransferase involved in cell wall biosynthesis|nr:methyltransferase domain-containing protein [Pyrinomonadaceae bacterium]
MLKLAYFSPLSPQRSGIADYSEALLPHLAANAEIDLFVDGFSPTNKDITSRFTVLDYKASPAVLEGLSKYDAVIYHLGNDHRYHAGIYHATRRHPGIVVLHDFALQHFFWGMAQAEKNVQIYLDELEAEAGRAERLMTEEYFSQDGTPPQLYYPLGYPLNYGLASRASAVIVHSEWARKRLQAAAPATSVYRIPHLIFDTGHDAPRRSEGKIGPIKIASFGRVTADKGIERALRSLAKLKARFDFEYTIVGEVCENFQLDALLRELDMRDRVRLVGHARIEEFVELISSTDIAINLREQTVGETSGSLCRIMAAGVAPIVSDIGWFSELPGDCAVKIDMETCTDELLEAYLIRLIEDADLREQIGSNARKYVLENYRVEDCAAKYLQAIDETLGTRARRAFISDVAEQVAALNINDLISEGFLPSLGREISALVPLPSASQEAPELAQNGHSPRAKTSVAVAPATLPPVAYSRADASEQAESQPDDKHRHGRSPLVHGLDYERGALEYVRQLDDEHRYYLRTKPFFNLARKPPRAFFDLDDRPPKYDGDGLDIESHRHICDFANMAVSLALARGSRILDVGCGSGWLSEWFARLGYDVTGVDISPDLIEMSRERLQNLSYAADHETSLRYSFETLNIEVDALDEQFDAVICYDSLHHFVDEHGAMKNLARMTKMGGALFILEGDKPEEGSEGAAALLRVMEKTATLESPFHPAYLRELLVDNGFMIVGDFVSVNGLYPRDSLDEGGRLPIQTEPVNYILCKKVADGSAARDVPDSRAPNVLSARLTLLETQIRTPDGELVRWGSEVKAGSEFFVPLEIENTGDTLWLAGRASESGIVQTAVRVLNADGKQVSEKHGSPPFAQAVAPGETRTHIVRHPTPQAPGRYTVKIDLVAEHVAWFEHRGSTALTLELDVV